MSAEVIEPSIRLRCGEVHASPVANAHSERPQAAVETRLFSWQTDLRRNLGDTNSTASPTALLLGALGGGAVVLIRDTLAPQLGVRVDAVQAEVRGKTDLRGLVAAAGATSGLRDIELDIRIRSPASEDKVRELYRMWLERCPVYLALTKPMTVKTNFRRIAP